MRLFGKAALLSLILSPVFLAALIVYVHDYDDFMLTIRDEEHGLRFLWNLILLLFVFSLKPIALTFPLVAWVRPFKIRRERQPPHLCRHCRYDMADIESGVCPECGKRHDLAANESRNWLSRRAFRRWSIPIITYAILAYGAEIARRVTFEPDALNYRTPFEQGSDLILLAVMAVGMVWAYWMYEGAMIRSDELGD